MTQSLIIFIIQVLSIGAAVAIVSWVYTLFDSYYGTDDIKRELIIALIAAAILTAIDFGLGQCLESSRFRARAWWVISCLTLYGFYWFTHRDDWEEPDAAYLVIAWIPCTIAVTFGLLLLLR